MIALLTALLPARARQMPTGERVYADAHGVIRWTANDREVALFGANYSLPSASDYRAAGMVGADRKKLIDEDFAHFTRMGWDGIRFCFWGDWENCDAKGNLIANDHLDVLDYAIAVAAKRGLGILFTPITTYSSVWPDGKDSAEVQGFSKVIPKDRLGTDPAAIEAQCNYLRQILRHVNPYTGRALKDEPAILFLEMINEPTHHSDDLAGSIAYINALAEAVRSTGCQKLLFHNLSQDFDIAPAIKASTVPGMTFAWYPTGLNSGHALTDNFLRAVDDYPPMDRPELRGAPKIVYEFDSADVNSGYLYPAMARAFRGAGAQFMTMFSYDMLATAPFNLGWRTHFLNLVYTPRKAVSAVIAAEVARRIPRYSYWGDYPDNRRFGPFRVDYEEDLSEMVTDDTFLHANSTATRPPHPERLQRIVGVGSSPIVAYEGSGAYFLDRIAPGLWRLELYPDAVTISDPFTWPSGQPTPAVRLITHPWPMTVHLPDLGRTYTITSLPLATRRETAADATFQIQPGIYLLSRAPKVDLGALPSTVGGVGLNDYVCPASSALPAQILSEDRAAYPAESAATLAIAVLSSTSPTRVTVQWRTPGETPFHAKNMVAAGGYRFTATLESPHGQATPLDYFYTADIDGSTVRFPAKAGETLHAQFVSRVEPVRLFAPDTDPAQMAYTRIGDNIRHGIFQLVPASGSAPAALRLFFPLSRDSSLDDYTASLSIRQRLAEREIRPDSTGVIHLRARGSREREKLHLTLVESDGTGWSSVVELGPVWQELTLPLDRFRVARGVKLPLGYPGRWNYWTTPAKGRGGRDDRLRLQAVEQLQFSLRPFSGHQAGWTDDWVDIGPVSLTVGSNPR